MRPRIARANGTPAPANLALAIDRGAPIHVGFVDTRTLPDGSAASSNADRVQGARDLVLARNHRPASPDEARRTIGVLPAA